MKTDGLATEDAGNRMSRMWIRLGEILESRALELAANGAPAKEIIEAAQTADACFWQSTGEGDFASLKDLRRGL